MINGRNPHDQARELAQQGLQELALQGDQPVHRITGKMLNMIKEALEYGWGHAVGGYPGREAACLEAWNLLTPYWLGRPYKPEVVEPQPDCGAHDSYGDGKPCALDKDHEGLHSKDRAIVAALKLRLEKIEKGLEDPHGGGVGHVEYIKAVRACAEEQAQFIRSLLEET